MSERPGDLSIVKRKYLQVTWTLRRQLLVFFSETHRASQSVKTAIATLPSDCVGSESLPQASLSISDSNSASVSLDKGSLLPRAACSILIHSDSQRKLALLSGTWPCHQFWMIITVPAAGARVSWHHSSSPEKETQWYHPSSCSSWAITYL